MPFGFHLTMDTLPSAVPNSLCGQRVITPAFGYGAPHLSARGTSTLLNNALLSAHYGPVRLPAFVHHRRTSSDFPMRPRASSALGERGTSRFPCEMFRYVLGVSDRAGLECASRWRRIRYCLPPLLRASASRRSSFSRLNTRPAPSPVNASQPPSRATPHDSEPVWFAKPSLYETFIHYTSPV